jgi:hypothetical protein
MKLQTPAEGILKRNDFGDSKYYQIVCGCGQESHDHNLEVEADECGVNVNVFVSVKTDYWTEVIKKRYDIDNVWLQEFDWAVKDIINGLFTRLKLTWTIWTKGYVRCETTITMSEQQALNYSETLKSAIKDVKEFKNQKDPKVNQAIIEAIQGDCV